MRRKAAIGLGAPVVRAGADPKVWLREALVVVGHATSGIAVCTGSADGSHVLLLG